MNDLDEIMAKANGSKTTQKKSHLIKMLGQKKNNKKDKKYTI